MNKPRLAEVLGVEVNEVFEYTSGGNFEPIKLYVSEYGSLKYAPVSSFSDLAPIGLLENAINSPERIARIPYIQTWTKRDVEDAKAVKQLFGGGYVVKKQEDAFGDTPYIEVGEGGRRTYFGIDCFPSLECSREASIDDILNVEVEDGDA